MTETSAQSQASFPKTKMQMRHRQKAAEEGPRKMPNQTQWTQPVVSSAPSYLPLKASTSRRNASKSASISSAVEICSSASVVPVPSSSRNASPTGSSTMLIPPRIPTPSPLTRRGRTGASTLPRLLPRCLGGGGGGAIPSALSLLMRREIASMLDTLGGRPEPLLRTEAFRAGGGGGGDSLLWEWVASRLAGEGSRPGVTLEFAP